MDFVGKGKWFAAASLIAVIASVVLLITPGLNLGIDFESGTTITYRIAGVETTSSAIRQAIAGTGRNEAVVQSLGGGEYLVRLGELTEDEKTRIDQAVEAAVGVEPVTLDVATVGRSVADDTVRYSVTAVAVASLFVMAYVAWAFRSLPHWHRYAIITIVTLLHDALVAMGVVVVLGQVVGTEVNAIFIVGILTVIGYSVNDTIVIFDRIRENALLAPNRNFRSTVNLSINETLTRSIATALTTATVILAMLLFGGETLQDFLVVLLTGVVVGTYSSIFVAAYLLVSWEEGTLGRMLGFPFRIFRRRQAEPA